MFSYKIDASIGSFLEGTFEIHLLKNVFCFDEHFAEILIIKLTGRQREHY